MKKVDIITLNNVVNYGSVLQTYALQEVLIRIGYNVEVINYMPERLTMKGMLSRLKNKKSYLKNPLLCFIAQIIMLPSYLVRFRVFKKFNEKYIKLTKETFKSDEDFYSYDFNADFYCTGSDQVWNTLRNEEIAEPFYLTFTDKPKFAYSASFGVDMLPAEEEKIVSNFLKKYVAISVREESGVKILKKMGINAEFTLDPTLLLSGDEWGNIAFKRLVKSKYILVYNLNRNKRIDNFAKYLSNKFNIKICYITYYWYDLYKKGRMFSNVAVEKFLSLFKYCECVITDSFHATAFSINFNKNFYIVYPNLYSTRLESILNLTGLKNRVVSKFEDADLYDNIDYAKVNMIINEQREKSMKYLKAITSKCEVISNDMQ